MSTRWRRQMARTNAWQTRKLYRHDDRLRTLARSQSLLSRSADFQAATSATTQAAALAQQASVDAAQAMAAVQDVDLSNYPARTEVPNIEETLYCTPLIWGDGLAVLSATAASGAFLVAPFPLRILSAAITTTVTIAANATSYWTLTMKKTGSLDIVARSTQVTGDGISARTAWTYDNAVWSEANRKLAINDVVWITATKTGTPAALTAAYITLRYARSNV